MKLIGQTGPIAIVDFDLYCRRYDLRHGWWYGRRPASVDVEVMDGDDGRHDRKNAMEELEDPHDDVV